MGSPDSSSGLVTLWILFFLAILAAGAVDVMYFMKVEGAQAQEMKNADGTNGQGEGKGPLRKEFLRQIGFWCVVGAVFNLFVWFGLGREAAGSWLYGYLLEYLLSVDNLFVFRVVFKSYSTPGPQVNKALFWGIGAAVGLRLVFFLLGTGLLTLGLVARLAFGGALIYSGIKTIRDTDDDESDPKDNAVVRMITRVVPLHNAYSEDGAKFFVRVKDVLCTEAPAPAVVGKMQERVEMSSFLEANVKDGQVADTNPPETFASGVHDVQSTPKLKSVESPDGRTKVTLLFLVVVSLGIIDLIFAVDSVTAKLSSIVGFSPSVNIFLNLTSSAFSMFVLRSLFFVLDTMVGMFRFLNLGVGTVLVLIGLKLALSGWVEVGMVTSALMIFIVLLVSIVASFMIPEKEDNGEQAQGGAEEIA